MKNIGYYGFSKEEYDSCRALRDSSNLRNVSLIAGITGVLVLLILILALFVPELHPYLPWYIFYCIGILLIMLTVRGRFWKLRAEVPIYGMMSLLYGAGIFMSVPSKNEKAILLLVIIVLLPMLFVDNAWRITIYLFTVCTVYCIIAWQVKVPEVAVVDLYNVACFGILTLIAQYFVNKKILDGYISRVQNEKLIQAYEEVQQELKRQACTDLMTGLYNRTYFTKQIVVFMEEARRNHDTIYLVMLDLDKFKRINDELGHQKGDEVIIQVAKIIQSHILGDEFATRLGGDEYMFILGQRFHKEGLEEVVSQVSREIHAIKVAQDWYASGSIGATRIAMREDSFDNLYRSTDRVLYEAKSLGGNRIVYAEAE